MLRAKLRPWALGPGAFFVRGGSPHLSALSSLGFFVGLPVVGWVGLHVEMSWMGHHGSFLLLLRFLIALLHLVARA